MASTKKRASTKKSLFVLRLWGFEYQVKDVQRSIAFYTQTLGFNVDRQGGILPHFRTSVESSGDLQTDPRVVRGRPVLRPMPNGGEQTPGGSNR